MRSRRSGRAGAWPPLTKRTASEKRHRRGFIDVTRSLVAEGSGSKRVFARGAAPVAWSSPRSNMAPGLPGHRRARAVRRHRDHHARRKHSVDDERERRVGEPNDARSSTACSSDSPYHNVTARISALLRHDGSVNSEVQYTSPRSGSRKLRRLKTDDRLLVMRVNMEAGHGGFGRFEHLHEVAEEYASILDQAQSGREGTREGLGIGMRG